MRVRLPFGRTIFFVAVMMLGLVILLPMRLALGWLDVAAIGLSAREVRGTVWSGTLDEAQLAGAPLGDLAAGVKPLPLLLGRAHIAIAGAEGVPPIDGTLVIARHELGIRGMTARLPVANRFPALPIVAIDLADVTVTFRDGLCGSAAGLVRASLPSVSGVDLPGGLSGAVRCEGGSLLLPLASQSGMERLTLHIDGSGTYRGDLRIRPANPVARDALIATGFMPGTEGLGLTISGAP